MACPVGVQEMTVPAVTVVELAWVQSAVEVGGRRARRRPPGSRR